MRWKRHYHYNMSTHDAWPRRLNRAHAQNEVSTTGVLFHFKLVAGARGQGRRGGGARRALRRGPRVRALPRRRRAEFYAEGLSLRYEDSAQLVALGLMSPGRWF